MAYSVDFRECVIRNIEAGMSWRDAAKTFKVSTGSISKWLDNLSKTGCLIDAPRKEYKPKKIDSQRLLDKIEETPDATLEELSQSFSCSQNAIWKRLKKLGITRKKNHPIRRAK
jgi:transposase